MEKVYPATKVEPLLKVASNLIHCLAGAVRDSEAENAKLRKELDLAKAASGDKVVLEKVASSQSKLTQGKIDEFVDYLATHAFIPEGSRDKYASACSANPDAALDFAMKAIQSAELPDPQGVGTPKSATFAGADHDSTAANDAFRAVMEMQSW